jgi:hypothetical protein
VLTVACVFVQGEYPYTLDYVINLRAMCQRFVGRTFRFVCLTDQPGLVKVLTGVEAIAIEKLPGLAPWSKLRLFDPAVGLTGRVLYLDLDSLLVNDLADIIDTPHPFALIEDELAGERPPGEVDKYKHAIVRRFNSSVMSFDLSDIPWRVRRLTRGCPFAEAMATAPWDRLSTDQDWIGELWPHAHAMPAAWFPRISRHPAPPWPAEARVVLVKKPKNHIMAQRAEWFAQAWGGGQ